MTREAAQRLARLQDADRARLERIGLPAARRITVRARTAAAWAIRLGHDPRQAVRIVIIGTKALGHGGLTELLTAGMLAAHLQGRRRAMLTAAPERRRRTGYKFAGSVYDEAIGFLQTRMNLAPADLAQLRQQYNAEALRVSRTASDAVEKKLEAAIRDTTATGAGVQTGVKALRQAFVNAGMVPGDDHALEAIFRTQTQTAYAAGRWQANQDPAVDEIIWGYTYVAIEDDRTTPLCHSLDGTQLPKGDPFWQRYWPPNHWNAIVAGGMVLTAAGERPIEDVRPGERVLTHGGRWRRVSALMGKRHAGRVMRVSLDSGRELLVTQEHPLACAGRGWQRADALKVGDQLFEYAKDKPEIDLARLADADGVADYRPALFDERFVPDFVRADAVGPLVGFAVDFERDLVGEREVNDVVADELLVDEIDVPGRGKLVQEDLFSPERIPSPADGARLQHAFERFDVGRGVVAAHSLAVHPSPACRRGRTSPLMALLAGDRRLRRSRVKRSGFGLGTDGDAMSLAPGLEYRLAGSHASFDVPERSPGRKVLVPDEPFDGNSVPKINGWRHATIIAIADVQYNGSVYNLAVEGDETYTVAGVVVHNCRSTAIEVFDEGKAVPPPEKLDAPQAGFDNNAGEVFRDGIQPKPQPEPSPKPSKPEPAPQPQPQPALPAPGKVGRPVTADEAIALVRSIGDDAKARIAALDAAAPKLEETLREARVRATNSTGTKKERQRLRQSWRDAAEAVNRNGDEKIALLRETQPKILDALAAPTPGTFTLDHDPAMSDAQRAKVDRGAEAFAKLVGPSKLDGRVLNVRLTMARRSYAGQDGIALAGHAGEGVAVHELGHVLEFADPDVHAKAVAFRERRTAGEAARPLSELKGDPTYDPSEVAKPDGFFDAYVGKIYGYDASEIVSMALQAIYDDAAKFVGADPEHFALAWEMIRKATRGQ